MNRFAQTTLWYTLVGLCGPLVALALTPLYTHAIGVAGYGTVDVLLSLWQGAYTVTLWGMATVLAGIYTATTDEVRRRSVVVSACTAVVLVALLVGAVLYALTPWIAHVINRPDAVNAVPYLIASLPFAVVYTTVLTVFRLRNDIRRVVIAMIALVVITALTRVMLVVVWRGGVVGMIQAAALTNLIMAVLSVAVGWSFFGSRVDGTLMRTIYRTGVPLLPVSVTSWVLLYADRWLLAPRVSQHALGQYALAVLVASLLAFAIEPLKNAWQPLALQPRFRDDDAFLALSYRLYLTTALLLMGLLVLATPLLLSIIGGTDALPAAQYVLPLMSMPVLGGVQMVLGIRAVRDRRTQAFGLSSVTAALVNLGLNMLFIPRYGVLAAAWSTALAALVATLVLALREPGSTKAIVPHKGVGRVLLWVGLLSCWSVLGPSWWVGCGLLGITVWSVWHGWSALREFQHHTSGIEPEFDDSRVASEIVMHHNASGREYTEQ